MKNNMNNVKINNNDKIQRRRKRRMDLIWKKKRELQLSSQLHVLTSMFLNLKDSFLERNRIQSNEEALLIDHKFCTDIFQIRDPVASMSEPWLIEYILFSTLFKIWNALFGEDRVSGLVYPAFEKRYLQRTKESFYQWNLLFYLSNS